MIECFMCKGAHPNWKVDAGGVTRYACTHHLTAALSEVGRGIAITVRGLL